MKVEFSLLSVLSLALLLCAAPIGEVQVHEIAVGFEWSDGQIQVFVDPVFLVTTVSWPWAGCALGCTAVVRVPPASRGWPGHDEVRLHELTHVRQFQALGSWSYPASLLVDWEGLLGAQWTPPSDWPFAWHFLTVSLPPT